MRPLGHAGPNQLQAARDASQEIVEVVRQASSQLPHGLHFLALPQRFLHQLALRALGHEPCVGLGQLAQVQLLLRQVGEDAAQQRLPLVLLQAA